MIHALIVAGGQGVRMGANQPKQYLELAGLPVLTHTLKAFDNCSAIDRMYLAIQDKDRAYCQDKILSMAQYRTPVMLVNGGARRQDSVRNGLRAIADSQGLVLIHDGVRPLVSDDLIQACIAGGQRHGACVPAVPVHDTVKQIDASDRIDKTVPRDGLYMAQTPQAFNIPLIRRAHEEAQRHGWVATDDASLVEKLGDPVYIIAGERDNIKVTTPDDMGWAEIYLTHRHQVRSK